MNQSKKIVLVASLAAFVVAVAWFLLLYQPQSNKLSDLNDDIESAKSEEVGLKAELSALEALKEQEPQIDAAVARADGLVPASPSLAAFMGEANAVATEAGLNWVTITPSEPEDTGVVGQVSLVVDLEGGFFETVNYLERMESMPRLVTWD